MSTEPSFIQPSLEKRTSLTCTSAPRGMQMAKPTLSPSSLSHTLWPPNPGTRSASERHRSRSGLKSMAVSAWKSSTTALPGCWPSTVLATASAATSISTVTALAGSQRRTMATSQSGSYFPFCTKLTFFSSFFSKISLLVACAQSRFDSNVEKLSHSQ